MSQKTHVYLPFDEEGSDRIGFMRKATAELTEAEQEYIAATEKAKLPQLTFPEDRAEAFTVAYAKLKAARLAE